MNKRKTFDAAILKTRIQSAMANLVLAILLLGLCFMILQPLFNKISISLMEEQDLYDATIVTLPRHFTLMNYEVALELMDFGTSFINTFIVAVVVGVLQVVSTLLVGYGFARYDFPCKKLLFAAVILLIVVPQQTYASALTLNFRYFDIFGIFQAITGEPLNLTGSATPVYLMAGTCTGFKCGLYVYLFRQYFRNVPRDIEESAYLDGCGACRTLFDIMLPDAMPLATSCFLFSFVWQWTDNYFTNLLMKSVNLLPTKLAGLAGALIPYMAPARPSPTYIAAINATGTLLILLPVILLYLVAQKKFVQSLSGSAIKM